MSSALILHVLLAAGPGLKLASVGVRGIDVPPQRASFYGEHLASQMSAAGARVITELEIGALIGMERQKQMLGCADTSASCMVELASALGVDGILLADIAKVGQKFQVNVKVIDAKSGEPTAIRSFRASDEEALLDGLAKIATEIVGELTKRNAPPTSSEAGTRSTGVRRWWWLPAVAALAGVGVGATLFTLSRDDYVRLTPGGPTMAISVEAGDAFASRGQSLQGAGVGLLITGGVLAAVAVLVWVMGGG